MNDRWPPTGSSRMKLSFTMVPKRLLPLPWTRPRGSLPRIGRIQVPSSGQKARRVRPYVHSTPRLEAPRNEARQYVRPELVGPVVDDDGERHHYGVSGATSVKCWGDHFTFTRDFPDRSEAIGSYREIQYNTPHEKDIRHTIRTFTFPHHLENSFLPIENIESPS